MENYEYRCLFEGTKPLAGKPLEILYKTLNEDLEWEDATPEELKKDTIPHYADRYPLFINRDLSEMSKDKFKRKKYH